MIFKRFMKLLAFCYKPSKKILEADNGILQNSEEKTRYTKSLDYYRFYHKQFSCESKKH